MFNGALALAYQPLPRGNRIALVTNAGGPAALAADALEGAGLRLARTGAETQAALRSFLIPDAQVAGPVDLLGGADEHGYRKALDAVLADPECDGVLAILVPQALVNPVAVVEAFGAAAAAQPEPRKPVLACLMGEASLDAAFKAAHAAQIPAYTFPEDAVAAFGVLWQRARWLADGEAREQRGRGAWTESESRGQGPTRGATGDHAGAGRAGRRALDAAEARAAAGGLRHRHAGRGPGDQPADEAADFARQHRLPGGAEAHQPRHPAQDRHRRRDPERAG